MKQTARVPHRNGPFPSTQLDVYGIEGAIGVLTEESEFV
jgi:hypothetical protein